MPRYLIYSLTAAFTVGLAAFALIWFTTFHPEPVETLPTPCTGAPPSLEPGQTVRVLSWNVQFMAGKGYYFFFEGGPDVRPESADIEKTLDAVAEIITRENPDIVLLQEVDVNAKRTDYRDQVQNLLDRLPDAYPCRSSAYYWKAAFVPHPKIMGAVGMKLVTLSKYRIDAATRYRLPLIPENALRQQFNLKRAVLQTDLPIEGGGIFAVLNTHLSAFAQGTDTLERQVLVIKQIMDRLSQNGIPWIAGGDFNLLPPGPAYSRLPGEEKADYRPQSEIIPLFNAYHAVPSLDEANGDHYERWYTHFPNDPAIKKPDKTIDYIFYGNSVKLRGHHVRHADTLAISDHLPVVAEFTIPEKTP